MGLWLDLAVAGLITGGMYALVAIGLNLQYGLMRVMNIAHGEFLMVGAYLAWWAHTTTRLNPLLALPLVFVVLFVVGLVVHRLCFRRVAREAPSVEVLEARSLLVGFGLMFLIQNAAFLAWGADLRGYEYLAQPVEIAGARFGANRVLVFGVAVAVSLALLGVLRVTLLGKAVRAMMQSPTGAQLVGIDEKVLHPVVFSAGLALAGVAGALLSMIYEISPSMGEPYTVTALIVITLGGLGSAAGSLVAGLLLGLVETFGTHVSNPSLKPLLSYGVFVAVLVLRPRGLFAR
ncbi:MAG: branched-chain amino acid ABC transporter permease [Candidatus Rokubacteria bacterium]|nr:branched-chain amino acid ABC transporter permease [Candidatus Rokubacteria bacterium]